MTDGPHSRPPLAAIGRPPGDDRPPDGGSTERGMTLVELLVTMAIVAGLLATSFYSIGILTNSDLRNEARRLSSAMKYTWTRAAMNNAQYRMVLDLENHTYHTEVADAPVVEDSSQKVEESTEKYLSKKAQRAGEEHGDEGGAETAREGPFAVRSETTYEEVEEGVVEKRSLPDGLEFDRVVSSSREDPIESEAAAIHYFPNGFQQPTIVVLTDGDGAYYSLKTEALTGRVHVFGRRIERPDEFGTPVESED